MSTAGDAGPPPVLDVLHPGDKAGPWIIERELGRGGMGTVYAVVHDEIGKRAALKVVHQRLLVPGFNAERMLLEAKVVNQVGHPNIVDIFETGHLADQRPYIVMERLEGQPLAYRADDGKILPDQVIGILLQVCDALIAAHAAGVVHRDLKLDNVFLVDNPEDPSLPRVKVLDWGIAKVLSHDVHHTVEGQLVGTPQYLSPEQARGAAVSPQTDVYSLGVMAYELFLEQLPFEAETSAEIMAMHLRSIPPPPSDLWPDIPPRLEELVLQMLAKQPDHRPTMLEVAHRLELVRDELRERASHASVAAPCATIAPRPSTAPPAIVVASPPAPPPVARELSPGLAPTIAAWPAQSHRWQWVAGAAAIVASAGMFLFTRDGDSSAAAAATATPAAAIEPVVIQAEPIPAPVTRPATLAATPVAEVAAPVAIEPTFVLRHTIKAPVRRATPASKTVASRKAPVMPRRTLLVDPDGTLDPYR